MALGHTGGQGKGRRRADWEISLDGQMGRLALGMGQRKKVNAYGQGREEGLCW